MVPLYFLQYDDPTCKWNMMMILWILVMVIVLVVYTEQQNSIERKKEEEIENKKEKFLKKIIKQGYYDIYITFSKNKSYFDKSIFHYINFDDEDLNAKDMYSLACPIPLDKLPDTVSLRLHINDDIKEGNSNYNIANLWNINENDSVSKDGIIHPLQNENKQYPLTLNNVVTKIALFMDIFASNLHRTTYYCSEQYNIIDLCMASVCNSVVLTASSENNNEIIFNIHSQIANELTNNYLNKNLIGYDTVKNIISNPKFSLFKKYNIKLRELREKIFGAMIGDDLSIDASSVNKQIKEGIKKVYENTNIMVPITVKELEESGYKFE
jgi:Ca2+/Na+ antiporter